MLAVHSADVSGPSFFAFGGHQKGRHAEGGDDIAITDARVNEQIRAREVRLVDADGNQLGIKPLPYALDYARSQELDLVEVAPNATPPVCRVMDHGKFKYEQDQRRKEARKKQAHVSIKEMKFRPKIDEHDYTTKVKHVERFLKEGSKVKLTIMFRGREVSHPELGRRILDRVADEVADFAEVEHYPRIDGRNMTMVLSPLKEGRRRKSTSGNGQQAGAAAEEPPAATETESTNVGSSAEAEEASAGEASGETTS